MNTIHWQSLIVLLSTCLLSGCDAVSGKTDAARDAAFNGRAPTLAEETETLKDQNRQLTQMLEEAESKLDKKSIELENAIRNLEEARTANTELEKNLSESRYQLTNASQLANQIRAAFNANSADINKQIEALSKFLPQVAQPEKVGENDGLDPELKTVEPRDDVRR